MSNKNPAAAASPGVTRSAPKDNKESNDLIQAAVENCAEVLFTLANQSELCVTHFLCGDKNTPGAIRKSALRARKGYLNDFAVKSKLSNDPNSVHRKVMREHIKYLDRKNTFLSMVESVFVKKPVVEFLRFDIRLNGELPECHLAVDVPENVPGDGNEFRVVFAYGSHFADTLIPKDWARKYFQALYRGKEMNNVQWEEKFLLNRAEVFGRTADGGMKFKSFKEHIQNTDEEQHFRWQLLGSLQSALLYFRGTIPVDSGALPEGTFIAKRFERIDPEDANKQPIYPVGVAVFSPQLAGNEDKIGANLHSRLVNARDSVKNIKTSQICERMTPLFREDAEREFRERIKNVFDLPSQVTRAECFSLWMVWLIEKLQKGVHEGHRLDFWLVAGDQTEFADHPNITFKPLAPDDVSQLLVPSPNDDFPQRIRRAAKFLEKEHFPWFQRGRYALFWDVGGDTLGPTGLVGIKGSNWEQVVTEIYKSQQHLLVPSCYLAYTGGAPKEAGVIVCTGDEDRVKPRFLKVLRWRNEEWRLNSDDRSKQLFKVLKQKLVNASDGQVDDIAKICLLVADNPQTGGTLVLLEGRKFNLFSRMGRPWPIDDTAEDRVALISHDGATLISLNSRKWGYRFLLTPEGNKTAVKKKLVDDADNPKLDFPLTGVGSRRWSAALASFNRDVKAIIVISQDGDIHCWASDKGKLNEKTLLLSLPQGDKAKKFDLVKKEWVGL